ncbi:MAG: heavy-metal-associated domain-containing protein [Candidatus Bathyarchaeota archaeon]|nr:heavy-metal-associated domain-containing protein [Candidatus Bathyarchaeota archaeon]
MQNNKKEEGSVQIVTFKLEGVGCACETKIIEKRIKGLKGVKGYDINPISNWVKVSYDPSIVSTEDLKKSISKSGMTASIVSVKKENSCCQ